MPGIVSPYVAASESCEIHQWAVRLIQSGDGTREPIGQLHRSEECVGCWICQSALEMGGSIAIQRAMNAWEQPFRLTADESRFQQNRSGRLTPV